MTDQSHRDIETDLEELIAKMEEYLSPDRKRLIDLAYKLSRREPEHVEVITSNSTSSIPNPNQTNA